MEYTLPTTAFVLKEVVTGRQPGAMVPQLPRVFPGRHRSDDRPKETALTIDRECWHTKSLQPFDTVLVLREDFFFHPWLGYGLDAPGRIEACLTQGTLNHLWITERFLAFMAGLPKGNIEPLDKSPQIKIATKPFILPSMLPLLSSPPSSIFRCPLHSFGAVAHGPD